MNILNEKKKLHKDFKVLRIGKYFGEISLLYGCKRTATVYSRKYTTLAKLTKTKFREIHTEYPEIVSIFKEGIMKYDYRMKRFMRQALQQIDFLKGLDDEVFLDVLYTLEARNYDKG